MGWLRMPKKLLFKKKVCQDCGTERELTKHHLRKGKTVILCRECHDKADELNPNFWKAKDKLMKR